MRLVKYNILIPDIDRNEYKWLFKEKAAIEWGLKASESLSFEEIYTSSGNTGLSLQGLITPVEDWRKFKSELHLLVYHNLPLYEIIKELIDKLEGQP